MPTCWTQMASICIPDSVCVCVVGGVRWEGASVCFYRDFILCAHSVTAEGWRSRLHANDVLAGSG